MAEEKHLKDAISVLSIGLSEAIAYPLTTILTRVQAQQVRILSNKHGPSAFTGGMSLLATAPTFFLKLVVSDALFPYFREKQGFGLVASYAMTAAITDAFACLIRTPAEIYRQQLQAAVTSSTSDMFNNLMGHHGPLGLWRGLSVFFLREVSFNSGRMSLLLYLQELQRNE